MTRRRKQEFEPDWSMDNRNEEVGIFVDSAGRIVKMTTMKFCELYRPFYEKIVGAMDVDIWRLARLEDWVTSEGSVSEIFGGYSKDGKECSAVTMRVGNVGVPYSDKWYTLPVKYVSGEWDAKMAAMWFLEEYLTDVRQELNEWREREEAVLSAMNLVFSDGGPDVRCERFPD